ncbi:MAG: GyrI-like domain-containing protein [Alphaproteobacteria bacterium]
MSAHNTVPPAAKRYDVTTGLAQIDAFEVAGISIITDNSRASEDINALWERFFQEQIGQDLQGRINDVIYAVYSDYEGDHEKPYRYTIGYRMGQDGVIPDHLTRICIADQSYAILSARGEQPKTLIETWEAVWSSDLPRSYRTDFELYGPSFFEDGLHEVLLHIGVENL